MALLTEALLFVGKTFPAQDRGGINKANRHLAMAAKETILYFGSFNPPHNGHTEVARYVAERGFCREVWFVVSPRNPFKEAGTLAPYADRLEMTRIAVGERLAGLPVEICDVEFEMPRPSYTIDTLRELECRFPDRSFALLGGSDLLDGIGEWKEAEILLSRYRFYIYPRDGYGCADGRCAAQPATMMLENALKWDFASADIRRAICAGGDVSGMVSPGVSEYIKGHGLYE